MRPVFSVSARSDSVRTMGSAACRLAGPRHLATDSRLRSDDDRRGYLVAKRAFDIVFSLVVIAVLLVP